MFKVLGVLAAGCAVLVTAAPARADLTPDGPATLLPADIAPCPMVVGPPNVTVAWRVTVGEGGRAGLVRPVFDYFGSAVVGDPVELPAAPGIYTFPAPHKAFDICADPVGVVQESGGHAIAARGREDQSLVVRREGQADERLPEARLTLERVTETDVDRDLLGDTTEDRTDLRITNTRFVFHDNQRISTTIVVTNAGPLAADLLTLETIRPDGFKGTWQNECGSVQPSMVNGRDQCGVGRLAAGESRTFTYDSDNPPARGVRILVRSEGEDLAPADNAVELVRSQYQPGTPAPRTVAKTELTTKRRHTLRRGVRVKVRGDGATRVTAAIKVRGRTIRVTRAVILRRGVERTITLRAHGAKLRTLRRAAARDTLKATITVRNAGGTATATTRVTS